MSIPRPEHPRPQFFRSSWENLNGPWAFAFDFSLSGKERKFYEDHSAFTQTITVPFCPESKLSGIEFTDFIPGIWYQRTITVPASSGRVLLHFGAVDYACEVYVNGKLAGTHKGGYAAFQLDITALVTAGDNDLVVFARDDVRSGRQPRGKQSSQLYSHNCDYTRTTGIWQTVWLEYVPETYLSSVRFVTDAANGTVSAQVAVQGNPAGYQVRLSVLDQGAQVLQLEGTAQKQTQFCFQVEAPKLWSPESPFLYDVILELIADGQVTDTVTSYFGVRTVEVQGDKVLLNGRPIFQRLVLDQGFYPDGIYTAPTDQALADDIAFSQALGFNGARLHQKVFEERFLYHADKMGYLVWGEQASWGVTITGPQGIADFLPEWLEVVNRDFNHPAIITWCPFNETWDAAGCRQDNEVLSVIYLATKAADQTRPVVDTSGNYHVVTDVFDIHDYEQDTEVYRQRYQKAEQGELFITFPDRQTYGGQPYLISEYGGARWPNDAKAGWGYGNAPKTPEEFGDRYEKLTSALLNSGAVCGFCYTQLYDIEQEQNGLYFYNRTKKLPEAIYEQIRKTNLQKAKIELED